MRGVQRSSELARILALPRRTEDDFVDLVEPLSSFLRKPHICRPPDPRDPNDRGCAGGFTQLNLLQAQALVEFHDTGGLFLQGPLGCGKTGVSVLAPTLLQAKRGLLIIPGGGMEKTIAEIAVLKEHWNIVPFRIASYQKLAREEQEFFFFEPPGPYDCVMLDEAHYCKNERTAVTRRIERLREKAGQTITIVRFKTKQEVRVQVPAKCPMATMTATPAKNSLRDVGKVMGWSMGPNCPVPRSDTELGEWCNALDADPPERYAPGALTVFSGGSDTLQDVRRGVGDRIFSTSGCIASSQSYVDAELYITLRDVPLTKEEDHHFRVLRGDPDDLENFPGWVTPDGEIFTDPADLWRHACSLALGYYTVWDPPAPSAWRRARYNWHHGVREVLAASRTLDTVKQVASAVDNGGYPHLREFLADWREIEPTFKPNSVPVWVGDTALRYAESWLQQGGIVWTWHTHFGRALAKRAGVPYFGQKGLTDDKLDSIVRTKAPAIVASVVANGVMHNLQRYNRNLIASIWPAGYVVEQAMGRTHRQGQLSPRVTVDWMLSCREQINGYDKAAGSHGPFYRDLLRVPSRLCGAAVKSEKITMSGWAFHEQED